MAWKGSGEERIRRFELYRLLEAKYEEAKAEVEFHKAQLASKDRTIRMLAAELAMAPTSAPVEAVDLLAENTGREPATFSEVPAGQVNPMTATVPAEDHGPTSSRPTSSAPPMGHSEMRPARTSVANGQGKELSRSIRERLAAIAQKQAAGGKK